MTTENKSLKPLDYEQYLSRDLQTLYFDDERYQPLRELIQSDSELVFSVRKDEIHIYYLGGRILKIKKSGKRMRFAFDWKYAKKAKGSDELNEYGDIIKNLNDNPFVAELWIAHFGVLKCCMKHYRENVSRNYERQLQQILELENRDFNGEVVVIDNEYGVREVHSRSSKLCKVDLVTLYKDNGIYKICLVELKCGEGAIKGKAGINEHISDFETLINKRRADIIASVNNLLQYKKANHSLYNMPEDMEISEDTKICASILCYDLPENQRTKTLSIIEKSRENITFDLHYNLTLNSSYHKLSKKDILSK